MRRMHESFPDMRRLLKDPYRSRILHDIILEEMGLAIERSQPSIEQSIAQVMAAGYHVTSQPRNVVAMRTPGTSQVTPADQQGISVRQDSQRGQILLAYLAAGEAGLTDEQAAADAKVPAKSCYWKRCGELRQAGLIEPLTAGDEDTPVRVEGSSGILRTVCVITPEGRAVAYSFE